MPKSRSLNVDDWYTRKPIPHRDDWIPDSKNYGTVNSRIPDMSHLKSRKDYSICADCGGTGFKFVKVSPSLSRMEECECDG